VLPYEDRPCAGPIVHRVLDHPVLSEALSAPELGAPGKKHLLQNASLLGHLTAADLLKVFKLQ